MFLKPCPICKEVINMENGMNTCPKCNDVFMCMDDLSERRFLNLLKRYPRRKVE